MDFVLGNTYKFRGSLGTLIVKFLLEQDVYYTCEVVSSDISSAGEAGSEIKIYKTSFIFRNYSCELVEDSTTIEIQKLSGTLSKRRSKSEIEIDNFIESCISKRRIEVLKVEIDEALISGDRVEFIKLTKELNKLQKKVTA